MKLKELQSLLQDVETFAAPKIELEQYPTSVELAASMLYTIDTIYHDLEGCSVLDLGCGTGRLAIGAALLGSGHVIGVDLDSDALGICQQNINQFDDLPVDLVMCHVTSLQGMTHLQVDTVIMNPPFGTRNKGADLEFLRTGLKIARRAVYSLHKTSTRKHISRLMEKDFQGTCKVVAQLRYDLPASYAFHKQKTKDIEVDLWRFEIAKDSRETTGL